MIAPFKKVLPAGILLPKVNKRNTRTIMFNVN